MIEFEMRLINNFSAIVFGEFAKVNGWPHLHFIDGVDGELYYLQGESVYRLCVAGRNVKLCCYHWQKEEENGYIIFNTPIDIINSGAIMAGRPIRSIYSTNDFES